MSLFELSPPELSPSVDPSIWPVGVDADPCIGPLAHTAAAGISVPLADGRRVRYANLDIAASAPALESVRRVVDTTLEWSSSVHRGAGFASAVCTGALAEARRVVADFVGARAGDRVVFVRNTTDALNLLAASLPGDTTVVTFASEHHANLLAWRLSDPVVLPVPSSATDAVASLDDALGALRESSPTTPLLVAVTGASNVTGELWPIDELAAAAHRHGARIVVDAAQLAPHRQIDIASSGIDYVAVSGHKLYAPVGAGALVGRADWLDAAEPYLAGGGASRLVTADRVEWADGDNRHEAGTPNVVGAVALAAACTELDRIGFDAIHRHERTLSERLDRGLAAIVGVRTYRTWNGPTDRIGVVVFNLDGWHHGHLAAVLSAEYGIGVRDGAFCAHRLVDHLVGDDAEGGSHAAAVRISLGLGSSIDDVDRVLAALTRIEVVGAEHEYRLVDGRYELVDDGRVRPDLFAAVRPGRQLRRVE